MNSCTHKFNNFEFDSERLALYFEGEYLETEKKTLEILAVLIVNWGDVVTHDEIIDLVWEDNPHGIDRTNLAQGISKLRKIFEEYDSGSEYIVTARARGYIFKPVVTDFRAGASSFNATAEVKEIEDDASDQTTKRSNKNMLIFFTVFLVLLVLVAGFVWFPRSQDDVVAIKKVVEESQKYESLVLYRDPRNVDPEILRDFWLFESKLDNELDIQRIRVGIEKLKKENKHYGPETKNEQFQFQSVELAADGDFATVRTLEKWFISEYGNNGKLVRNKTIGPYFVYYVVRKVNGRWLVARSSTARATPNTPVLTQIKSVGELHAGEKSFVKIDGSRFVPENLQLFIVGPGCAAEKPCIVTNSELRLSAQMTRTRLEKVPITLQPGDFIVFARNGESAPSNSLKFTMSAKK